MTKLKFAKGYNQKRVNNYIQAVKNDLDSQPHCVCSTSCSTYAGIDGRNICNNCGRPIKGGLLTITVPYWFYKQSN